MSILALMVFIALAFGIQTFGFESIWNSPVAKAAVSFLVELIDIGTHLNKVHTFSSHLPCVLL